MNLNMEEIDEIKILKCLFFSGYFLNTAMMNLDGYYQTIVSKLVKKLIMPFSRRITL